MPEEPAVSGRCGECGFDYDEPEATGDAAALAAMGRRYRAPLTRFLPGEDGDAVLRAHPRAGTWSALEYACHVRDVLDVQRGRIERALAEDVPTFEPMDREGRVERDRYNDADPVVVADQLAAGAGSLADLVEGLSDDDLARRAVYHDRGEQTLAWVVRHTVHEGQHHLLDVGRVLRAARGR